MEETVLLVVSVDNFTLALVSFCAGLVVVSFVEGFSVDFTVVSCGLLDTGVGVSVVVDLVVVLVVDCIVVGCGVDDCVVCLAVVDLVVTWAVDFIVVG